MGIHLYLCIYALIGMTEFCFKSNPFSYQFCFNHFNPLFSAFSSLRVGCKIHFYLPSVLISVCGSKPKLITWLVHELVLWQILSLHYLLTTNIFFLYRSDIQKLIYLILTEGMLLFLLLDVQLATLITLLPLSLASVFG